jgi:hypothetical protein
LLVTTGNQRSGRDIWLAITWRCDIHLGDEIGERASGVFDD